MQIKKIILIGIVLVLAFLPSFGGDKQSKAASTGEIMVSSFYDDNSRVRTVNLSVSLRDVENLQAGSLSLQFDPNMGYPTSVEKGELLSSPEVLVVHTDDRQELQSGEIQLAFASPTVLESSGNLLEIEFRLLRRYTDSTDLQLYNVQLFNGDGNPLPVQVTDGAIKPFDGKSFEKKRANQTTKSWTVEFNTPMKRNTLNPSTVYVMDSRGNRIPVKVDLSDDKKKMIVTPLGKYSSGDYTLYINENVKSSRGNKLKKPVEMAFTIN